MPHDDDEYQGDAGNVEVGGVVVGGDVPHCFPHDDVAAAENDDGDVEAEETRGQQWLPQFQRPHSQHHSHHQSVPWTKVPDGGDGVVDDDEDAVVGQIVTGPKKRLQLALEMMATFHDGH